MNTRTYIAIALTILTSALLAATGYSQESDTILSNKVDQLFAKWDKPDSPGAAVVVIKNGAIIHKRGYGMANLEYGVPISPSTIFEVGSVAKQFTAMAIALLAAQGEISLDDDIHQYIPEVPDFGKTITIRNMIHHTSGMRNWEVLFFLTGNLGEVNSMRVLQMIRHQRELNFDPGEEYSYCNTGYLLLAEVVQRVTGQTFREWTRANIFEPLGMTHTIFQDDPSGIVKERAYGYMPNTKGEFRKVAYTWAVPGPTSLFTTAEDLSKWMKNFDDKRLGGSAVIEQIHEQGVLNNGTKLDYAFGLQIGYYRGLQRIYHEGGWSGFRSVLVLFPEGKFGVVILSNLGLGAFHPTPLANQITDIYLADQLAPIKPPSKKTIEVSPNIYDAYIGQYVLPLPYTKPKIVTIVKENDRLMGQMEGQPKETLLPESENAFFVKDENVQINFLRDENGKVNKFKVQIGDWKLPLPARRLKKLNQDKLKEFVGDFFSNELSTTWNVTIRDGNLLALHSRQKSVRLWSTGKDHFTGDKWWFQEISFIRDNYKRVTGFRLSAEDGLVRNLRFDKQHQ